MVMLGDKKLLKKYVDEVDIIIPLAAIVGFLLVREIKS